MICIARTLGAPDSVPAGSTERSASIGSDLGAQVAGHRGDDVHDVGVGLDGHERLDLDRAVLAHPAEVVAAEVDEHDVLGALLLVLEQLARRCARRPRRRRRAGASRRSAASRRAGRETVSSGSGLAPATWKSPKSRKYMYGLGFTVAQAAVDRERLDRHLRRPALARARPGRRRPRGRTRRSARPSPRTAARSMFERNSGIARPGERGGAGTGPARRSRTSAIVSRAAA